MGLSVLGIIGAVLLVAVILVFLTGQSKKD
jgi:hypothetical protein